MAIGATAVWEVRSSATAGNVNGGFYTSGGTDFSQQDAAQFSTTTATTSGAGAVILWAAAASSMVGNGLRIVSGTNFTSGWYEITSVSVGVSVTVDRNCCTGAGSNGVINVGGAMSLNSSDDALWESFVAGNTVWIKNGSYTQGGSISMAAAGGASSPIAIKGYNSTRGDDPVGTSRPLITQSTNTISSGTNVDYYNIRFTGTAATCFTLGTSSKVVNCRFENTSTTASRVAFNGATDTLMVRCEAISYRGIAISSNTNLAVIGCYVHDSDVGVRGNGTGGVCFYSDTIVEGCVTAAIQFSAANVGRVVIQNCTLYGAANKLGTGVSLATGVTDIAIMNTIISGFVTGVNHADVQTVGLDLNNCFNNNTTNATNWTISSTSITTDPSFTSVAQVTGTAATTSGSVLTDGSKTFVTSGVVAGDYLYLVSGTGITAGVYGITAVTETTLTLDIAPGTNATADKVYQVTTGHNFGIGTNPKAVGIPALMPGGYVTSYKDMGAVQRQEDYPAASNVLNAVSYGNSSLTGTYVTVSTGNVKTGTAYGAASALTGTYDGSDRWTDPGESNVRSGTAYKANSTSNNKTGTCAVPAATDVRTGVSVDATTGNVTLPPANKVENGYSFGANGTEYTGTLAASGGAASFTFVG